MKLKDQVYHLHKIHFIKVLLGLAQAPAYFEQLIKELLKGLEFALRYLDGILIFQCYGRRVFETFTKGILMSKRY